MGNAPLSPLRGTCPRRGKFALRLLSCSISCSRHRTAKISPSGGDAAVGGRRGAFPAPVRAVVWFSSRQERGCKGFIILAPQAPTTTLTAKGHVKPLNPLHLLNPHARQGVSMQAPKGGSRLKAAFILAPQASTTTLTAEGRVKPLNPLHLLNPHARQGVSMHPLPPLTRSPSPIDGGGKF